MARDTGIVLDPVYTGKAVQGLLKELRDRPSQFAGKKILFIHTGNYRNTCHHEPWRFIATTPPLLQGACSVRWTGVWTSSFSNGTRHRNKFRCGLTWLDHRGNHDAWLHVAAPQSSSSQCNLREIIFSYLWCYTYVLEDVEVHVHVHCGTYFFGIWTYLTVINDLLHNISFVSCLRLMNWFLLKVSVASPFESTHELYTLLVLWS